MNLTNEMGEYELKAQFVELRAGGLSSGKIAQRPTVARGK
jgi:hypothetical protein